MPEQYTPETVCVSLILDKRLAELYAEADTPIALPIPPAFFREAVGIAGPAAEPFTSTEQAILDVLRSVGAPMSAEELSDCAEVGVSPEQVIRVLSPRGRLRSEGLVKHKPKSGYYATPSA